MRFTRQNANFNFIPEEILIEIIVRLPVKSIVRFTCACKSWSNMLTSSSFVGKHLHINVTKRAHTFLLALTSHHQNNDKADDSSTCKWSLFSSNHDEPFSEYLEIERHPLSSVKQGQCPVLYGSSNGLVCLAPYGLTLNSPIRICNPSIRKSVTLPKTSISALPYPEYICTVAFGFHPDNNDYKAVRMASFFVDEYHFHTSNEIEVYSLSTKSWQRIGVIPPFFKAMTLMIIGCAMFDGVACWIMRSDDDCLCDYYLVSFDAGNEVFEEFLLPEALQGAIESHDPTIIEQYKGSICLLQYDTMDYTTEEERIDIWLLKDKLWNKLRTIVIPGTRYGCLPLGFGMTGDEVVFEHYTIEKPHYHLALFKLETEEVVETGNSLIKTRNPRCNRVSTYVESLVLFKD